MNKLDLVTAIKHGTGLTRSKSEAVVNQFFDEIAKALANGDRVEIRGMCSFYVKEYKEYIGRNPKTGTKVKVNPKKLPFFKCGTELRKRVDS